MAGAVIDAVSVAEVVPVTVIAVQGPPLMLTSPVATPVVSVAAELTPTEAPGTADAGVRVGAPTDGALRSIVTEVAVTGFVGPATPDAETLPALTVKSRVPSTQPVTVTAKVVPEPADGVIVQAVPPVVAEPARLKDDPDRPVIAVEKTRSYPIDGAEVGDVPLGANVVTVGGPTTVRVAHAVPALWVPRVSVARTQIG